MRILMVGDIIGRPGREAVKLLLPGLRSTYSVDLAIANGENAAGGRGLTPPIAEELFAAGIDIITSGNHIWDQKEIIPYLDQERRLLRPLNYPPDTPGRGYATYNGALIINTMGRLFIGNFDCPFRTIDELLHTLDKKSKIIIVDFHAEATSEKVAYGWFLDGRVSAVLGTHTHVPTADARILPNGTAHISDVGMVGPSDSVIGVDKEIAIQHFLTSMPFRLEVAKGPIIFNSVLVEIEDRTGRAISIRRIDENLGPVT